MHHSCTPEQIQQWSFESPLNCWKRPKPRNPFKWLLMQPGSCTPMKLHNRTRQLLQTRGSGVSDCKNRFESIQVVDSWGKFKRSQNGRFAVVIGSFQYPFIFDSNCEQKKPTVWLICIRHARWQIVQLLRAKQTHCCMPEHSNDYLPLFCSVHAEFSAQI